MTESDPLNPHCWKMNWEWRNGNGLLNEKDSNGSRQRQNYFVRRAMPSVKSCSENKWKQTYNAPNEALK